MIKIYIVMSFKYQNKLNKFIEIHRLYYLQLGVSIDYW